MFLGSKAPAPSTAPAWLLPTTCSHVGPAFGFKREAGNLNFDVQSPDFSVLAINSSKETTKQSKNTWGQTEHVCGLDLATGCQFETIPNPGPYKHVGRV